MLDREKLNRVIDAYESIVEISDPDISINAQGEIKLTVWPKSWVREPTDDERHTLVNTLTPLVGKMDKQISGTSIGFAGSADGISVSIYRADVCKVVGYKTKITKKPKVIEVEDEFVEEEERIAITDCDIKAGKFSEADIEVPA